MNTRAWLSRVRLRSRGPSLDLALLTASGARYAGYRLGLVWQRALLRSAIHAAELWLLSRDFPFEFAVPLFTLRAGFGLASSMSWGPLESLRRRVREEMHERRPDRATRVIEAHLLLSYALGLLPLVYAVHGVLSTEQFEWAFDGLYGFYLLVGAACFALDLPTRVTHAGVFALGRVYRPSWSVVVPELLELAALVLFWQVVGPFAIAFSWLLAAPLRSLLAFVFARRAYRARDLPLPRFVRLRALRQLGRRDMLVASRGAFAMLPGQLDRILLLALLGAPTSDAVLPLAAPYYALRPLAGTCQGWARTYYADFVRLDTATASLFRARLDRLLNRTSVVAGLLAGGGVTLGAFSIFGIEGLFAGLWLTPLLIVRSAFAVAQVRAMAYARDDAVLKLSLIVLAALLITSLLRVDDRSLVMLVALILLAASPVLTRVQSRARLRFEERARRVSVSAWLADVAAQARPVRIRVGLVDVALTRTSVALSILGSIPSIQRCCRVGRAWVLWWELESEPTDERAIIELLSGTVTLGPVTAGTSGKQALVAAQENGSLPSPLHAALSEPSRADELAHLERVCAERFPAAFVVDAHRANPALSALSSLELATLRGAIASDVREQRVRAKGMAWHVAAYAPRGEPVAVFVWPDARVDGPSLRRLVRAASWRASVAG